ncbi:MAG: radical SAM protein [Peptococcaceae bacterium]|nr:radical SAM protein [Peptococcaceae bacterium]
MLKLLYATEDGTLYEDPELEAAGWTGNRVVPLTGKNTIPLPPGADLMLLPGRTPVGWDVKKEKPVKDIKRLEGKDKLYAVGAILPAGHTRTLLPGMRAYSQAGPLPLYGYTAVGAKDGEFYAAALVTDEAYRWNPLLYNDLTLPKRIKRKKKEFPGNRLVEHLAHCSLDYHCLTAQNIFYERWEAGIPVSPGCNAECLGCISLQPSGCCASPQQRIDFVPSQDEIVQLATAHLEHGAEPIISFGQGCEGEPLMQAPLIAAAVKEVRKNTPRGTININTNAGATEGLKQVCEAGLDSIRVSLISAREEVYNSYHRPRDFTLGDVKKSIKLAKEHGVYVSLNLLVIPGLTDREEEAAALESFIDEAGVDMVQLRNLNIDPYYLFQTVPPADGKLIGIPALIDHLRQTGIRIGNYTHEVR